MTGHLERGLVGGSAHRHAAAVCRPRRPRPRLVVRHLARRHLGPGPFLDPYPPVSAAARASWVARACDTSGTRSTPNSAMDQSGGWWQLAVRQVLAGVDTIGRACAFTPTRVPPPVRRAPAGVGQSCLSLQLPVVIPVVAGSGIRSVCTPRALSPPSRWRVCRTAAVYARPVACAWGPGAFACPTMRVAAPAGGGGRSASTTETWAGVAGRPLTGICSSVCSRT
jgi:hypothetical protein